MSGPDHAPSKFETFRALHAVGRPLLLFNVWDAGSALAVADTGAAALATGSWSVAAAHGHQDGERLPFDLALDNIRRIVATTRLPVSMDIEGGYADDPDGIALTIARVVDTGVVGCNLEDGVPSTGALRPVDEQAQRIRRARAAADARCEGFFINARTDVFFQGAADRHDDRMVDDALRRAEVYAGAGADGVFVPGLADHGLIERFAARSPLPVNIMGGEGTDIPALARAGAARISFGPAPYLIAMRALADAARAAMASGMRGTPAES